jgi:hypothetical protein
MTKSERDDLQRLIRQREKVQKSAAKQRSADLLADFENQIAAQYSFDDDAVWAEATKEAEREVAKAQKRIAERCRELGIPMDFAPSLRLNWHHRGYGNSVKERREELRRVAKAQIEALERQAIVKIEQASVEAQTEIALAGLTSETARAFVERLPTVESLMPALSYQELAGESDPPFVEQLVTPNALRQRRYRERQRAALHDAHRALQALRPRVSNAHGDASSEPAADDRAAP